MAAGGNKIFPVRDGDLAIHLQNFHDKLATDGKTLKWDDATIQASQERCARVIAALTQNRKKLADYKSQVAATKTVKKTELGALRADIRQIKANPAFNQAMGRNLGIMSPGPAAGIVGGDKANATGEVRPGAVRIRWKKGALDGVNVYMRRQGDGEWRLLGRDNVSPYDDTAPLAKPGVPEVREYRVHGVVKDLEVGAASDIISVLFSG